VIKQIINIATGKISGFGDSDITAAFAYYLNTNFSRETSIIQSPINWFKQKMFCDITLNLIDWVNGGQRPVMPANA
jgi:hypothetical protein